MRTHRRHLIQRREYATAGLSEGVRAFHSVGNALGLSSSAVFARARQPSVALAWIAFVACVSAWLSAATCQADRNIEAYTDGPLGVGRVTITLPSGTVGTPGGDDRLTLIEQNNRLLYPVVRSSSVGRIVRQFIDIELPNRATFYFMFRGNEPLLITADGQERIRILPENDREEYNELLDDWWEAKAERYEKVHGEAEYPVVVENYVTANWARRLGRRMPEPDAFLFGQRRLGATWLAQLTANEGYQAAIEREIVLGRGGIDQRADLPLPRRVVPERLALQRPTETINVEPIAAHVPVECFYVRFGSFTNYLWFRDFLRKWQGDLGNMIVLRSIDRDTSGRLQQQLALRETKIARVMGPAVIRDVAIIGLDFYLREGAAMGVLFHANSNRLLSRNINDQREGALKTFSREAQPSAQTAPGATLSTVKIADHDVSFLSSPDGRLRSYYAIDGDFHLVTTSRRLVERFYEAGQGRDALAAAAEFQTARQNMPLERDDTIFAYLSTAFFENLASPQYRIELDRRLRSIGEGRILTMARLAAAAERQPAHSIDELIDAELLPAGFGQRADGSVLVDEQSGFHDSLRGTPGWFTPVPDVWTQSITPAEADRYEKFQNMIREHVGQFVPIVAAIGREPLDDSDLDRITTDVRIAPYSQTRLARWADQLGPPETRHVAPVEGDLASVEVLWSGLDEPVHLFGGLRDFRSPLIARQGAEPLSSSPSEYVRGYIGAWPRPHVLDRWVGTPSGPADADGNVRYRLFNLWRRQSGDFFLFSFKQDVLTEVGPQLRMVEAERPAQVRMRIADPSDSDVATGISGLGYMRARQTSASATRFMNSLASQLHVPPAECREVAERLVGGRFTCPLGGEYALVDASSLFSRNAQRSADGDEVATTTDGRLLWTSTAATPANQFLLTEIPADYRMPLMDWFRGMTVEVARMNDAVTLHSEVDMVHQEVAPAEEETGGRLRVRGVVDLLKGWTGRGKGTDENPAPELNLPPPAGE